jgi:hypothetical protein
MVDKLHRWEIVRFICEKWVISGRNSEVDVKQTSFFADLIKHRLQALDFDTAGKYNNIYSEF